MLTVVIILYVNISSIYLSYNWNCVPFDHLHPIPSPCLLPLVTTNPISWKNLDSYHVLLLRCTKLHYCGVYSRFKSGELRKYARFNKETQGELFWNICIIITPLKPNCNLQNLTLNPLCLLWFLVQLAITMPVSSWWNRKRSYFIWQSREIQFLPGISNRCQVRLCHV